MIVSAIVIVGYTSLGGFNAASMTDFIQSIIMTVALIIVLVFGINQAGGMEQVIMNAKIFPDILISLRAIMPQQIRQEAMAQLKLFQLLLGDSVTLVCRIFF